jgi:hypothetical protein
MKEIALFFDFFVPVFFFFLGRSLKGNVKKEVIRESFFVFLVALIFTPVVYLFTSLSVQIVFCAFVMLLQGVCICKICYKKKILPK